MNKLPTASAARKGTPVTTGVLDYFPLALAAVARLSKVGNDKHNPGQPLHWSRDKSSDHADCVARHLIERGTIEPESGELHDVCQAWRSLAQCQLAEEKRLTNAEARPTNTTVGTSPKHKRISFMWGDPGADVSAGAAASPFTPGTMAHRLEEERNVADANRAAEQAAPPPRWLIQGKVATKIEPAKKPFTFWYLATPYSKYPHGHDAAATLSSMMAARLLEAKVPAFAPIAHSHPISRHTSVSNTDHHFWIDADAPFINLASGLIVVTADGWKESRGMAEEIKRFEAAGKPIVYWAPWFAIPASVLATAPQITKNLV